MTNEPDDSAEERRAALRRELESRRPPPQADDGRNTDTRSARGGIAQAWRLSSEFLAGVLVGFGLGWGFDKLFGTAPWGMIVFVLLGFGAAILNVLRAAGRMAPSKFNIESADDDSADR